MYVFFVFVFLTRSTLSSRTRKKIATLFIFLFYPAIYNKSPLRQSCKVNHFSFKWFPFPLFLYVQLQQRNREVCVCMRVVNSDWCWETGRETWSPPKGWATVVVFVVGGGGLLFVRLFPTLSLTFLNYVSLHACWRIDRVPPGLDMT